MKVAKVALPNANLKRKKTWQYQLTKMAVLVVLFGVVCFCFSGSYSPSPANKSYGSSFGSSNLVNRMLLDDEPGGSSDDDDGGCQDLHQHHKNQTEVCDYIRSDACSDVSFYLDFYYCGKTSHIKPLSWIIFMILMLLLFYLLSQAADVFFCPTLEVIGGTLRMSPEVAGLTILALGNGAPDLSTSISSLALSRPIDIVTGSLFGAAMFVTTVVVAIVSFLGRHVQLDPPNFIRDISFYLVAVVGVYFITWDGKIVMWEAIMFLVYYVAYVAFALITHYCGFCTPKTALVTEEKKRLLSNQYVGINNDTFDQAGFPYEPSLDSEVEDGLVSSKGGYDDNIPLNPHDILDDDDDDDDTPFTFKGWVEWFNSKSILNRVWIMLTSLVLLPLYLSIPTAKWNRYAAALSLPCSVVVTFLTLGFLDHDHWLPITISVSIGFLLGGVVWFTTKFEEPPVYKLLFTVISFFMSIAWIFMVADQLVAVLQSMGVILGIPSFVLGATVLAWGNSVGDLIADVMMAKKGFPGMALSAAYGGPMMNMLLGMGIGLAIRTGKIFPNAVEVVASKAFLATGGFVFLALYSTLIVLWIRKFKLSWWWGVVLLAIYGAFSLVTALIEAKVIWKGPLP